MLDLVLFILFVIVVWETILALLKRGTFRTVQKLADNRADAYSFSCKKEGCNCMIVAKRQDVVNFLRQAHEQYHHQWSNYGSGN